MKIKHLFTLGVAMLISATLFAQSGINNSALLKSELDTISKQKLNINSVALSQAGDWIILYGDIGFSFVSMPEKLAAKLDTVNANQIPVKDIDFIGNNGWILLSQGNAFLPARDPGSATGRRCRTARHP